MTDETRRAKIIEWLDGYMSDCDNDNACNDCLCQDLCLDLDDCAPRAIKEIIEQQRDKMRCKNCKHFVDYEGVRCLRTNLFEFPSFTHNDFCSYFEGKKARNKNG